MRRLFYPLIIVAVAAVSGCGGGQYADEMRIARETGMGGDERAIERADAQSLYNTARGFLESGDPMRALELYSEVQSRYPFTEYAVQAELESIYAHLEAFEHAAAISAADRFIKQHPRHEDIDYVYYLRGLTNYQRSENTRRGPLAVSGTKRDPSHLRQAFTDFNLLIQNFPQSPYRKDAQLHMVEIKHRLADYELNVAEYYLRRRAWVAASRRAQHIVERYQGADALPRALEILEHSYRELGLEELALDTRAILQASYPNYIPHRTEFYRQRAGLEPAYKLPPMDDTPTSKQADEQPSKTEGERVSER